MEQKTQTNILSGLITICFTTLMIVFISKGCESYDKEKEQIHKENLLKIEMKCKEDNL